MDFEWIVTKPDEDGNFDATCVTDSVDIYLNWLAFAEIEVFKVDGDTVFINTKDDLDQLKLLINLGLTREEINDYFHEK